MRTFETYQELESALAANTFLFSAEFFPAEFRCSQCRALKPLQRDLGTGYARDTSDNFLCYECAGENEARDLRETGKGYLYLTRDKSGAHTVSNWPGTLTIPVRYLRKGAHNIARTRYDVWFTFEGAEWHGVQYGEWTQICHVRRLKRA